MDKKFYINWHITNKCNLRCKHCYQDRFDNSDDITFDKIVSVFKNITNTLEKWNKKLIVTVTGGEPFLKQELLKILYLLDKNNLVEKINIITNGTILNEEILKIKNKIFKFDTLFISLDGTTPDVNDNIRGKNVFNKVIKNIQIFKENKYKIVIMFVVSNFNFDNSFNLYNFSRSINVDGFIIERFIPLGQSSNQKKQVLNGQQIQSLYKKIFEDTNCEYEEKFSALYRSLYVKFKKDKSDLFGALCSARNCGICVLPDATVLPCRRFYLPIGNLLKDDLDIIWSSSEILKKIQNKKNYYGKCRDCKIKNCYGCRALTFALTNNYLGQDIQCLL